MIIFMRSNCYLKLAIGFLFIFFLFSFKIQQCSCDDWEYKLVRDMLANYDSSIRPSLYHNGTLNVTFGLSLAQIIDVDERNMIITTNCWLNQGWIDYKLRWNPDDYDGIQFIHIPAEKLWKPDILLVNNADSWAKISSISTNAIVKFNGNVTWLSTVIFKSSCAINVKYFPFDEQSCDMIFSSWTFDGFFLDINVNSGEGDMTNYIKNGEWHLVKLLATKYLRIYSCCEEPYPEIYYKLIIRRRPLYYVFNMVFPCLLITLVAFLGFFLPPDSSEKVSIGITTLLSLTVFLMLVAESMPPTSEQLPLLGIYYAVTISIVSFSTGMAVVTLNVNNKGSKGRKVPKIVRIIFFDILAKILRTKLSSKTKFKQGNKSSMVRRFGRNNTHVDHVRLRTIESNLGRLNADINLNNSKNFDDVKYAPIINKDTADELNVSNNTSTAQTLIMNNDKTNNEINSRTLTSKNRLDSNDTIANIFADSSYFNIGTKSDGLILKASEEDLDLSISASNNSSKMINSQSDINLTKNNERNQFNSKSVCFDSKKPMRPTTILKNSKFDMLSESFQRGGSCNSFSALYTHTPISPANHMSCICDCSNNSLNHLNEVNSTNQSNRSTHAQMLNSQPMISSKYRNSFTISSHNEEDDNYDSDSPMAKSITVGDSKRANLQKLSSQKPAINSYCSCHNQLNYSQSNYSNVASKNLDQEFLGKLEKILERQFDPLVKMLMHTLKQNERRLIEEEKYQEIQDEWSDVALIADHFLCFFFPFITFLTCILIFFNSPHVLSSW